MTTFGMGSFEAPRSCVFPPPAASLGYILSRHEFHPAGLVGHHPVSRHHSDARSLFPLPLGQERGRLLCLRTQRFLVAGRHVDGGDHICRRHAAGGHRSGLYPGGRRELGVWAFLLSGMMTVFLFARLWRRSGLLTDVQFAEMRYSGKPAAFLRGFRAMYLGLLMNCLILGWVTKAKTSIVGATLGTTEKTSLAICIFFLIPFT